MNFLTLSGVCAILFLGALSLSKSESVPEPNVNMIGFKHLEKYRSEEVNPPFRTAGMRLKEPLYANDANFVHEQIYIDNDGKIVSRIEVYNFGEDRVSCEAFDAKVWAAVSKPESLTFKVKSENELSGPMDVYLKRRAACDSDNAYVTYLLSMNSVSLAHDEWESVPATLIDSDTW